MLLCLLLRQEQQPVGAPGLDIFIMIGGVMLIMYFLVIRPSRRQEARRQEMLGAIKKNDKVLTSGGLYGVVMAVRDDDIILKIDDDKNVRVRVARTAIASILDESGAAEKGAAEKGTTGKKGS